MKKLQIKGFVMGLLVMAMLSGITVWAAARSETINVTFNNIRLVVNDRVVVPTDAAGNTVEPFIWQGTTFLPVRAVATALGQDVRWEESTQTVYIFPPAGQVTTPTTPTTPEQPPAPRERVPLNQ